MYANFVIQTGEPVRATAVPYAAVVREGLEASHIRARV